MLCNRDSFCSIFSQGTFLLLDDNGHIGDITKLFVNIDGTRFVKVTENGIFEFELPLLFDIETFYINKFAIWDRRGLDISLNIKDLRKFISNKENKSNIMHVLNVSLKNI